MTSVQGDDQNKPQNEADYDGEDESGSEGPSKKRKTEGDAKEKDVDSITSGNEDSDNESVDGKKQLTASTTPSTQPSSHPAMTPREIHQDRRNRLRAYYSSGTFYGSPAAYIAFRVSTQLRFGEIGDLLWFAWYVQRGLLISSCVDLTLYLYFS
jgi:hypothetical protein